MQAQSGGIHHHLSRLIYMLRLWNTSGAAGNSSTGNMGEGNEASETLSSLFWSWTSKLCHLPSLLSTLPVVPFLGDFWGPSSLLCLHRPGVPCYRAWTCAAVIAGCSIKANILHIAGFACRSNARPAPSQCKHWRATSHAKSMQLVFACPTRLGNWSMVVIAMWLFVPPVLVLLCEKDVPLRPPHTIGPA